MFCHPDFSLGRGVDVVHNPIHIPLGQELKTCPFRKHHTQHGVDIFNPAFLAAAHRDRSSIVLAALEPVRHRFQVRPGRQIQSHGQLSSAFKHGEELIGAKTLLQVVEDKPYSALCTAVHQECQEEFTLSVK